MIARFARLLVFVTAVSCAVSLPTISTIAQDENREVSGPIAIEGGSITDIQIQRRIGTILNEIDGLQKVDVYVHSGVVTLRGRVASADLVVQAEGIASRVEGVVAVHNQIEEITDVSERIVPVYERFRERTVQFVNYLPLLAVALLVFSVIALAGHWLASRKWPWSQIAPNSFIAHLLQQIVRIVVLAAGLVVALDILNASALLGTMLGAAGIVGLAVGFAVRDTVENYIASILLSLRQPFRPNDYVDIAGECGSVIMLTSRATILLDDDGNHVRIPNSTVFKGLIKNYSRNPERRFSFKLTINADSDIRTVLDTGIATIAGLDFVLDEPEPAGWIVDQDRTSVTLQFAGWINQTETSFVQARSEALRLVSLELDRSGVSVPVSGYKVQFDPPLQGGPKRDQKKPAKQAVKEDAPADTSADDTVAKKIEEERAASDRNDLLDEAAPQEIG